MPEVVNMDALVPAQIAVKAEDVGVAKGRLALTPLLMLAVLAGAFIAMGAVFSTVSVTGAADALPWGVTRVIAGVTFSLGLILVVVAGAELFTGNNLLVMAFVSRKLSARSLLRNWAVVYLGNLIGSVATAGVIFLTAQHEMASGKLGVTMLKIADAKCDLTIVEAFTRGVYCNALVCLAVWLCMSCRTTGEKIAAIVFPITAFVAVGFEHCVANMYFIPVGLFVQHGASPEFWAATGTTADSYAHLSWSAFLLTNLLPVTLGNIVGGAGFVGLVYWIIYRRNSPDKTGATGR
ncbi:MAG: formate transporter FocA [Phycisphaera sp.]|nr:formate transporter FocA [Phycisphaera sp.]